MRKRHKKRYAHYPTGHGSVASWSDQSPPDTPGRGDRPEEYAGYRVLDPEGRKVGTVKALYANGNGEPEYVRVRIGFLGLRSVLLPVEAATVDDERHALVLE